MTLSKVAQILSTAKKENRKNLFEHEAKTVCSAYGIPVTKFRLAKDESEAAKYAEEIGYPTVLKIVSPDVIHKSDVGGVKINLKDATDVKNAYAQIINSVRKHQAKARIIGMLVQEMAPSSTEVIVGSTKDAQFGHAVMFGLGGIFVEVLKDVSFRIAPLAESEACEMIKEVRAYPLLNGYRNLPPADINSIVKILLSTSKLVTDCQEIKELDLNPIMVYTKGAKTVDARIILE